MRISTSNDYPMLDCNTLPTRELGGTGKKSRYISAGIRPAVPHSSLSRDPNEIGQRVADIPLHSTAQGQGLAQGRLAR